MSSDAVHHTQQLVKRAIAKTLQGFRAQKRLTQEDLAGLCNVDRSYISMIEVGRNEPSVTKIFELCEGLGISVTFFFQIVEREVQLLKKELPPDRQ
jgi:transcriptional regulator with XRE-family HTH domain